MLHRAAVIPVAFLAQGFASDLVWRTAPCSIDKLADKLADKFFDGAVNAALLPGHLDETTLGKPKHIALSPHTSHALHIHPHPIQRFSGPRNVFGAPWSCRDPFLPPPWGFPLRACSISDTGTRAVNTTVASKAASCPHAPEHAHGAADMGMLECKTIPGPEGFGVLGEILKIPVYGIEEATLRWGQAYGPFVRLGTVVFLNEPEYIEHVCGTKSANYGERYLPDVYKFATDGKGILASGGAFNKQHRTMCQGPFVQKRSLQQFSETTTSLASELVSVWKASSESGEFQADISEHMQRLTLDIIGKVAFTYDFGGMKKVRRLLAGDAGEDDRKDQLMGYVNAWTQQVGKLSAAWITLDVLKLGTRLGDPRVAGLLRTIEGMRGILFEIIDERRKLIRDGAAGVPDDLMTELINLQEESGVESFTDTELWEDIHDVMGAGHETSANVLTTALWEISMHAEVGVRIQEELDAVCGTGPDRRLPTFDDYENGKLSYTTMVIKETLRLYPPIPLLVRQAKGEDQLPGGYAMHDGDLVFMSAYALGRTERFWENPYRFDPERFTSARVKARSNYMYLPFGAGPRMCLGARFALMSTVLMLATIMQSYSFTAVRPNYRSESQSDIPYIGAWRGGMPFEFDLTMSFPEGCTLKAVPRK